MIPQSSDDKLQTAIQNVLIRLEKQLNHTLPKDEFKFLVNGYAAIIDELARKYIQGSIQHLSDSPFFHINFELELHNELLDTIHYELGKRYVKANRTDAQSSCS